MPIYEYDCPGKTDGSVDHKPHTFEKIVPMAQGEESQECPQFPEVKCPKRELSTPSKFQWGVNVVDWSAGLGSNPHGMGRYKNK